MHLLAHALHCIAYAIIFAAKYYKFPSYQDAEMSGYLALAIMAGIAVSHTVFVKFARLRKTAVTAELKGAAKPSVKGNTESSVENDLDPSVKFGATEGLQMYSNAKRIVIKREIIEIYND